MLNPSFQFFSEWICQHLDWVQLTGNISVFHTAATYTKCYVPVLDSGLKMCLKKWVSLSDALHSTKHWGITDNVNSAKHKCVNLIRVFVASPSELHKVCYLTNNNLNLNFSMTFVLEKRATTNLLEWKVNNNPSCSCQSKLTVCGKLNLDLWCCMGKYPKGAVDCIFQAVL